jgi:hypothetical protein
MTHAVLISTFKCEFRISTFYHYIAHIRIANERQIIKEKKEIKVSLNLKQLKITLQKVNGH